MHLNSGSIQNDYHASGTFGLIDYHHLMVEMPCTEEAVRDPDAVLHNELSSLSTTKTSPAITIKPISPLFILDNSEEVFIQENHLATILSDNNYPDFSSHSFSVSSSEMVASLSPHPHQDQAGIWTQHQHLLH